MKNNLVRLSKADTVPLPLRKATLYKWHHLDKFPQLFVKIGGAVFIDMSALDDLIEDNRSKAKQLF